MNLLDFRSISITSARETKKYSRGDMLYCIGENPIEDLSEIALIVVHGEIETLSIVDAIVDDSGNEGELFYKGNKYTITKMQSTGKKSYDYLECKRLVAND